MKSKQLEEIKTILIEILKQENKNHQLLNAIYEEQLRIKDKIKISSSSSSKNS